jgi:hypothetical protein
MDKQARGVEQPVTARPRKRSPHAMDLCLVTARFPYGSGRKCTHEYCGEFKPCGRPATVRARYRCGSPHPDAYVCAPKQYCDAHNPCTCRECRAYQLLVCAQRDVATAVAALRESFEIAHDRCDTDLVNACAETLALCVESLTALGSDRSVTREPEPTEGGAA